MPHTSRRGGIGGAHIGRTERGQSLVEFALVLPMLLVLLLGIADFGRVFSVGITLEAAARDGAEAAAQEYVQLVRNNPGGVLVAADYARLHSLAISTVCHETATLQQHTDFSSMGCARTGVAVCVHDAAMGDPCGSESGSAPMECSEMVGWSAGIQGGASATGVAPLAHVEVRTCYLFQTIIPLAAIRMPFNSSLSLGDIWLQKSRQFAIACYPTPSGTGCG